MDHNKCPCQSGGILISWDKRKLELIDSAVNQNRIWARWQATNMENDSVLVINGVNVYAPQNSVGKNILWEELSQILASNNNEAFCIAKDFNSFLKESESSNCTYRNKNSSTFLQFIQGNNLWDIKPNNQGFTWFSRSGKRNKMDRILVNATWVRNVNQMVRGYQEGHQSIPLYFFFTGN